MRKFAWLLVMPLLFVGCQEPKKWLPLENIHFMNHSDPPAVVIDGSDGSVRFMYIDGRWLNRDEK